MQETPTGDYLQRNEWNVRDSDGTVIFTIGPEVSGGTFRTLQFAGAMKKPLLHLHVQEDIGMLGERLRRFVSGESGYRA